MPCAQYTMLVTEYPSTTRMIVQHYLPDLPASVTTAAGKNPAGYLLWQLRRAGQRAVQVHGAERATLIRCDSIFAAEVAWQRDKKTVIKNVIPFFGACWSALVTERGERFTLPGAHHRAAEPHPDLHCVRIPSEIGGVLNEILAKRQSRAG